MVACTHAGGHTIAEAWSLDGPCRVRCDACGDVRALDSSELERTRHPNYYRLTFRGGASTIVYRVPIPEAELEALDKLRKERAKRAK